MRIQPLSTANAGMTRLRNKGGASPETLYDLLNGYITLAGTIRPRPGTLIDITLPIDTKGLVAHKGKLYVFKHEPDVTSNPDKYVVAVLRHPTDPGTPILQIHFAAPFMGFLYVAAEFLDGNIWHYWLEELDAWSLGTDYMIGDRVFPTVENGYAYQATRAGSANPAWAPNIARAVNDVVEPTVYNGFKYTVVAVSGGSPASGAYEPEWPTEVGAQVIEYADGTTPTGPTTTVQDPNPNIGTIPDRYDNPAGGFTSPIDYGSHF
jgi:hypothetical protein